MNNAIDLLFPVGRFVAGSLYQPNNTNMEGQTLSYKTGPNAGKDRYTFYIAVAIKKTGTPWDQTAWGKIIAGHAGLAFPAGQSKNPNFAWKMKDGDSQIPNQNGIRPCDRQGFAGHWVIEFKASFPSPSSRITMTRNAGKDKIQEDGAINLGDYIQVFARVSDNGSQQKPGLFYTPRYINFAGFGERITLGIEAHAVGFSSELPDGASSVPAGEAVLPVTQSEVPAPPITPYTEILNPKETPRMTPKSTVSYEDYKKAGWADEQLRAEGLMY